jgi:hypothetical protein
MRRDCLVRLRWLGDLVVVVVVEAGARDCLHGAEEQSGEGLRGLSVAVEAEHVVDLPIVAVATGAAAFAAFAAAALGARLGQRSERTCPH